MQSEGLGWRQLRADELHPDNPALMRERLSTILLSQLLSEAVFFLTVCMFDGVIFKRTFITAQDVKTFIFCEPLHCAIWKLITT